MVTLYTNEVIRWLPNQNQEELLERVLWVGPDMGKIVVIQLLNDKALPMWRDLNEVLESLHKTTAVKTIFDERHQLQIEEDLTDKYRNHRDKAWEIISELISSNDEPHIYSPSYRGQRILEICEKYHCTKTTIYQYLRRYWQGGKTKNALLPHYWNCGAPGQAKKDSTVKRGRPKKITLIDDEKKGVNVDEETKRLFRAGIRLFYNNRLERPLSQAFDKTIDHFFNVGYRIENGVKIPVMPPAEMLPTKGQFLYWFKKEQDLRKTIMSRKGEREFHLKFREILGNSTVEAFGPGSRYQIDATIGDVYLVHPVNRNWIIGRPVIYAIIDVFSRLIVGVYVGLEGPSWIGAMMALANAASDKVEFCAQYGVNITEEQWPVSHLPEVVTADRGEMVGDKPTHLINSLRVDVQNLPPFRADWKGIIERQFRISNDRYIHWLPGAVKKRIRERGERDYRLDAKLDLDEMTKLVIVAALYHNNEHRMEWYRRDEFMVNDEVEPYPIKLWEWGIKKRGGRLQKFSEDVVRLNLMPSDKATVTDQGIVYKQMFYSCDKAIKEQWFLHAKKKRWNVPISFDPRLTNYIYIRDESGQSFEKCSLLEFLSTPESI